MEIALFSTLLMEKYMINLTTLIKYDILLNVKEILFHDKKTEHASVFKRKRTILFIILYWAIYLSLRYL